jgi:hypothetical protein
MPVTSIFWPDETAQDIHLVPGFVGPRLDHLLWIAHTAGNVRADAIGALPGPPALAFDVNFVVGAPGTGGVAFNAGNGEVSVAAPLSPSPRLLDFIVTARVVEGAAPPVRAWKRFSVHNAITRLWLTPSTLTVRRNARNVRFTILAEFDDGTYGDMTAWCPRDVPAAADRTYVRQTGSNDPAFDWSTSAAGTVGVHASTGRLTGNVAAGNATITASLRPLPAPAGRQATGTARAAAPWSTAVPLTLIDGPGFAAMGRVANVLILPDGFLAADRAAYERLARELVQRLRVRRRTRPFDLLRDQMNYFTTWIESREAGISPLPLVRRFNVAGPLANAEELDTSVAEAAVLAAFHIAAPPVPAANDRFLLNERDTAFHVSLGDRSRAMLFRSARSARPHPSRFDPQDFDDFLNALQDPGGAAVGGVWAQGGKDQAKLVMLSRSLRDGGANNFRGTGRLICMTLDLADRHSIENNPGGFGKDLRPEAIPVSSQIEIWTTTAHELGHSFTLEDEYGGRGTLPADLVAAVARGANVAARATLLTGANLDADKIQWRWPRAQKAGAIAATPIAVGGGRFRVRLQAGHGAPFVAGDVIRFRLRPLLTAPAPSDRLIVLAVAADELEFEPLTAAPFAPATYAFVNAETSPVVIRPARATDPNAAGRVFGDDLELMHQTVRARINATRNPLNARDGDAPNRPCPGALPTPTGSTNWPDTDLPPNGLPNPPRPPVHSSWIVGLYENGFAYECNVYRPTGVCLMRRQHFPDPVQGEQSYQFCPVCRYAMVDVLDPSKHGAIDADYAPRYPT